MIYEWHNSGTKLMFYKNLLLSLKRRSIYTTSHEWGTQKNIII